MSVKPLVSRVAGSLGLAIGLLILIGALSAALFSTAGDPWGSLTDLCKALAAILGAALAGVLYPSQRRLAPWLAPLVLLAALAGALLALVGAALVLSSTADSVRAGQFTQFGSALIGVWLIGANTLALQNGAWPRSLALWGVFAGLCMAVGLLNGVGIVTGLDARDPTPWFLQGELLALIGTFVLYPIWAVLFGRAIRRPADHFVAGV